MSRVFTFNQVPGYLFSEMFLEGLIINNFSIAVSTFFAVFQVAMIPLTPLYLIPYSLRIYSFRFYSRGDFFRFCSIISVHFTDKN